MRTDDQYGFFWERTTSSAETAGVQEPKLPKRRQVSRRIDSGADSTTYNEPVDYFRRIYFQFVDYTVGCVTDRFNQRGFDIYTKTECLMLNAFHGNWTEAASGTEFDEVTQHFHGDLDSVKLKIQMEMLSSSPSIVDASIVNVDQVIDKLLSLGDAVKLFTEVTKLIRLCLTIPVSSATAERSFSALRRLKTFTRSTMNASRLTHLALLHVHQDRTDKLDLNDLCKTFVKSNERRQTIFCKHAA